MSLLLKVIYKSQCNPCQNASVSKQTEKGISQIHMESQETLNIQNNAGKKEQVRGLTLSDFKTYRTAGNQNSVVLSLRPNI